MLGQGARVANAARQLIRGPAGRAMATRPVSLCEEPFADDEHLPTDTVLSHKMERLDELIEALLRFQTSMVSTNRVSPDRKLNVSVLSRGSSARSRKSHSARSASQPGVAAARGPRSTTTTCAIRGKGAGAGSAKWPASVRSLSVAHYVPYHHRSAVPVVRGSR